jgi:hypothetical protein
MWPLKPGGFYISFSALLGDKDLSNAYEQH